MRDGLSVPVVGPSTIFPRGYLWLAPIWCVAALGALALANWLPSWLRLGLAAGLLTAMITFLSVVATIKTRAFRADTNGVRLGLPQSTRRRGRRRRAVRNISWQQIDKVRILRRRGGAVAEFLLGPSATLALRGYNHNMIWQARRALLLLIPFWYLLRPTGLASPLSGPPRYRVTLADITPDQLARELRVLAPANVAVTVRVRKRASVSSAAPVPGTISEPA
jgi:hypothetical protein